MIQLKWNTIESVFEDTLGVLQTILQPKRMSDVHDFFHAEGNYFFLPNLSEWADKGTSFFMECKNRIFDYFLQTPSLPNNSFSNYLLESTPDVFAPFLKDVLISPNGGDAVSSLSNTLEADLESIWGKMGFDIPDYTLNTLNIGIDLDVPTVSALSDMDVSFPLSIYNADGGGGLLETAKEVLEGAFKLVKDVDWVDLIGRLGSLFGF